MRTCPVCRVDLDTDLVSTAEIDRCPSCGGTYYDQGELESIIGLVRLLQAARLREEEIDTVPSHERARVVRCPADGGPMRPQEIGGLVIDTCPECAGIWLDAGEVGALKLAERNIRDNLSLYVRLGS